MLLQVMKMSQTVQLPAATTVSSLCTRDPRDAITAWQWRFMLPVSLDGCHFKIVPLQTLCDPEQILSIIVSELSQMIRQKMQTLRPNRQYQMCQQQNGLA